MKEENRALRMKITQLEKELEKTNTYTATASSSHEKRKGVAVVPTPDELERGLAHHDEMEIRTQEESLSSGRSQRGEIQELNVQEELGQRGSAGVEEADSIMVDASKDKGKRRADPLEQDNKPARQRKTTISDFFRRPDAATV